MKRERLVSSWECVKCGATGVAIEPAEKTGNPPLYDIVKAAEREHFPKCPDPRPVIGILNTEMLPVT